MSACLVCEADALQEIAAFRNLPRVTSDCKPFAAGGRLLVCATCGAVQKQADERWLAEIDAIYRAYQIYEVAGGAEQLIFAADGAAAPRSRRLIDALRAQVTLPERGRLIDIGCGNGAALGNFAQALPQWELYGSELSDRAAARLKRLPNFRALYTVAIGQIPGRYDLVSMIHSLEHMPAPAPALRDAAGLLADNGVLFVEVPDVETSAFDLLVADHLMHFSAATLGYLAGAKCGVRARLLTHQILPKELTLLAERGAGDAHLPDARAGRDIAERTVAWLSGAMASARQLAAGTPELGVFGTSISAMWLYGALGGKMAYFVDEDPAKIGRSCAGKPIYGPAQVPQGATVYVPLVPEMAHAVARRLGGRARYVVPPG
jgi:SAM-dependent methyltransferase